MTDIDGNTVTSKDGVHLLDDAIPASFNAEGSQDTSNVIGLDRVEVDRVCFLPDSPEVNTIYRQLALFIVLGKFQ